MEEPVVTVHVSYTLAVSPWPLETCTRTQENFAAVATAIEAQLSKQQLEGVGSPSRTPRGGRVDCESMTIVLLKPDAAMTITTSTEQNIIRADVVTTVSIILSAVGAVLGLSPAVYIFDDRVSADSNALHKDFKWTEKKQLEVSLYKTE